MTAAERYGRLEASRSARSATDVTTERRPMPRTPTTRLPDWSGRQKPWLVVKVRDTVWEHGAGQDRVVISSHDKQEVAEAHAGTGRDALTDTEVGAGWNVVAERRKAGKR